jgi:4-amino-4-deoxy-L-arabinose transferase-like glycosyltransferase
MALGAVLLLALVLRLAAVLWLADTHPHSDHLYYHLAGQALAQDWGFFFDRAQVEAAAKLGWWPPLYPVFLGALYSLFGPQHRVVVFVQVVLGVLVCWLVYRIGRRAAGARTGILAALLVALNPTYVFLTNLLASENLYALWLALGLWLVGRTWRTRRGFVLPGVVFALGALTRAVGVGVPAVAALWLRRRSAGRRAWLVTSAWLLGASALVIAPWTLRNQLVVGSPALVCFGGGLNFYFGHNPVGIGYRDLQQTPMAGLRDQVAVDAMGYRLGWQYLGQDPFGFWRRGGRKIGALFGSPGYAPHGNSAILLPDGWRTDPEKARQAAELRARQRAKNRWLDGLFTHLGTVHSWLLLVAAAAAAIVHRTRLPDDLRLAVWLSLYWVASHVVFWGQPRFRYPMEIPLALLAAFAVAPWTERRVAPPGKSP